MTVEVRHSFAPAGQGSDTHRTGSFVTQHISPVTAEQVQPNGADLTLKAVLEQVKPGRLGRGGKTVRERRTLDCTDPDTETYRLDPGGYVLQYAETVHIPEDHVDFIYPRSSFMRNSCMLDTVVWDTGYEGKGEGLLKVHHPVELERGARVAQIILTDATRDETYDDSYQGKRTR